MKHAGLDLNNVAKTFLFFRASQLPQRHVDNVLMQLQGDMSRFTEAKTLVLRMAHRQSTRTFQSDVTMPQPLVEIGLSLTLHGTTTTPMTPASTTTRNTTRWKTAGLMTHGTAQMPGRSGSMMTMENVYGLTMQNGLKEKNTMMIGINNLMNHKKLPKRPTTTTKEKEKAKDIEHRDPLATSAAQFVAASGIRPHPAQ